MLKYTLICLTYRQVTKALIDQDEGREEMVFNIVELSNSFKLTFKFHNLINRPVYGKKNKDKF